MRIDGSEHTSPRSESWSPGSCHEISVPSPQERGDTRYIFDHWSDGGGRTHTVCPSSNTTYTAYFRSEPITVTVTIRTDYGGGNVVVDGRSHSSPYTTNWNRGSSHTITAPSPQGAGEGIRYVFERWSDGGGRSHSVSPRSNTTYTAYYRRQYRLTVHGNPSRHDSPSPSYGEHWYDQGTRINANVSTPADESGGVRYRCTGHSGTGSAPSGNSNHCFFNLNSASTLTWNWQKQYRLVISASPSSHDSPSPSYGTHWYDDGTTITARVVTPCEESDGVRWRLDGWSASGSPPSGGVEAGNSVTFTIREASSITWRWVKQYYLTITYSGTEGREPQQGGEGWWDEGSVVNISTIDTLVDGRYRFIFQYWTSIPEGDYIADTGSAITTVHLTCPLIIEAHYFSQYYYRIIKQPCAGVGFLRVDRSAYYGEDACMQSFWWDRGSSHIVAVSQRDSLPEVLYIFKHWTDDGEIDTDAEHYISPILHPVDVIAHYRNEFFCSLVKIPRQSWGWLMVNDEVRTGVDSLAFWAKDGDRYLIGTSMSDVGPDSFYVFRGWSDENDSTVHTTEPITEPTTFYADYSASYYYLNTSVRNPFWDTGFTDLGGVKTMSYREGIEIRNFGNYNVDYGLMIYLEDDLWRPGYYPDDNQYVLLARFNSSRDLPREDFHPYRDIVLPSVRWASSSRWLVSSLMKELT